VRQRAIVAALAHPPILLDAERTSFCLRVSDRILCAVAALGGPARRSADFRVLAKGLMYALSVFVAVAPAEGFAFLNRWAAAEDPDIRRIVRANLGKARLARRYPARVAEVLAVLEATGAPSAPANRRRGVGVNERGPLPLDETYPFG